MVGAGISILSEGWGGYFLIALGGLLAGMCAWLFGPVLRFLWRSWRGMPSLRIDRRGISGATLGVRGGQLTWSEVLDVDYQTTRYSVYPQLALAVGKNVRAGKGTRYLREIVIDLPLLAVDGDRLLALLRTGQQQWSAPEGPAVHFRGRPVGLTLAGAAVQDARLDAIKRGERVVLDRRRGKSFLQLWLGIPLCLVFVVTGVYGPYWFWSVTTYWDDESWVAFGGLLLVALLIVPLFTLILIDLVDQRRRRRDGVPQYILDASGLQEPNHLTLTKTVPWPRCVFAHVHTGYRSPDIVFLHVNGLAEYLRNETWWQRAIGRLQRLFKEDALSLDYGAVGLRPDELRDLLNAAIDRWAD